MDKIYLSLNLSQYLDLLNLYKKEKNVIKKSKLAFKLLKKQSSIIENLDEENITYEELFSVLKEYEKTTGSKIFFNNYRIYYQEEDSEEVSSVDGFVYFYKENCKDRIKVLSIFGECDYKDIVSQVLKRHIINPNEVVNADVSKVMKNLHRCKGHYEKICVHIIKYLLYK